MLSLRGVAPLLLTGTSGVALLAFGISGLSGVEPQLQRAAQTVEQERTAPQLTVRQVDCPWDRDHRRRSGDV